MADGWKKKIFLSMLAGAAVLTFTGVLGACSGEKRNGSGAQEEFDYQITVGFVQSGEENSWKAANTESFKSTFIEDNGYELLYEDAGLDQEKQYETIRKFIEEGVDYIVLAPVVETGWEEILEEVKEAGIPVILIQNQIDETDNSLYECWIGSDYKKQAREAGKWLENYLKSIEESEEKESSPESSQTVKDTESQQTEPVENENVENKDMTAADSKNAKNTESAEESETDEEDTGLRLAVIQGNIGSASQMSCAEVYQEILEKHPDWNLIGQQTGENTKERAKEVMKLFLEEEPDLDIVIAENDAMALGAFEAAIEAGKTCGPDGDIILISFGAGREVLQAVAEGKLNAAFEQNPIQAPKTAEIIQKIEAGVSIDKKQYVSETYYDASMDLQEIIEKRNY